MGITPFPETVWMYYLQGAEAVAEKSQDIFQRFLSDEEYVGIIGTRTGEMVLIYPGKFEQSPGIFIPVIYIHHNKTVCVKNQFGIVKVIYSLSRTDDRQELTFQNCEVPAIAQKKGLATRMLTEQVAAARSFGFERIVAFADNRDGRNGHYTWSRLGFDKRLTAEEKSRLPPQFADVTLLSDLMEQPKGRDWWRDHGFPLELAFDTSLQSRSMRFLHEALARLDQKTCYWDSGPDTPLHIERGAHWRPRRGWVKRIWEYRPQ